MAKKSEELTRMAIEISGLEVRAQILELWNVLDALRIAYDGILLRVRLALEEELEGEQEKLAGEEEEI